VHYHLLMLLDLAAKFWQWWGLDAVGLFVTDASSSDHAEQERSEGISAAISSADSTGTGPRSLDPSPGTGIVSARTNLSASLGENKSRPLLLLAFNDRRHPAGLAGEVLGPFLPTGVACMASSSVTECQRIAAPQF
jgi:hypothetical protein